MATERDVGKSVAQTLTSSSSSAAARPHSPDSPPDSPSHDFDLFNDLAFELGVPSLTPKPSPPADDACCMSGCAIW